jgi:hypothetical protein
LSGEVASFAAVGSGVPYFPMLIIFALGLLTFSLAFMSDWLETQYVKAVGSFTTAGESRFRERAARCSVAMWLIGILGWMAVLEVGWWVVIPEGLGLYLGTKLAMKG